MAPIPPPQPFTRRNLDGSELSGDTDIVLLRKAKAAGLASSDFGYLDPSVRYFDSACQTLRPQCVIDAELQYYKEYNACGGRVKYPWGERVDRAVASARKEILRLCGKSEKEYAVAFTLNTTYGINLVLHQLPEGYAQVITSDIEHNSVHLPVMTWSERTKTPRLVCKRSDDGTVEIPSSHADKSVVILNTVSNIDGRSLRNAPNIAKALHREGGILLLDAAQGFAHGRDILKATEFDAAFGSGHKMYGPSIGFIVIRRSLLQSLQPFFIGGGTVSDVKSDGFTLLRNAEEEHAVLEAGLQNWGGIVGLNAAAQWLATQDEKSELPLAEKLFAELKGMKGVHVLNREPSSVLSFCSDSVDAHRMAIFLSERSIMCRSGYFCCHRYLLHDRKLPPLLRVSLAKNNTPEQVDELLRSIRAIISL